MNGKAERLLDKLPLVRDHPFAAYSLSLFISAVALVVRLAASTQMDIGFPYVGFFPAVIIAAFLCGTGPAILTAALCGVFAWYFFIPPVESIKMSAAIALTLVFYAVVAGINILVLHWMQLANGRLRAERERNRQLAERTDLLFRELQHRVSNNLQVVAGLLALQKRDIADGPGRVAIDDAARRLGLIGRIHRTLYDPSGEQMRLTAFLQRLSDDLIETSGKTGIACAIEAHDDIILPPDAAVPMALIVAESISNAIEHGFADRDEGRITISAHERGGHAEVTIADDGAGLPDGFDLDKAESLGLRLAQLLAMQLRGSYSLTGGAATTATLRMPIG